MGTNISTERFVSNIKCYGELSRQKGHNCYTHKELTKLAKSKGKKASGTKKELAERLGLRYVDFFKYSSLYSLMGFYEYRTIHMGDYDRYVNGISENINHRYTNRIAGLMIERLVVLSSNDTNGFVKQKSLGLLKITEKELNDKVDLNISTNKIIIDDVGKIFDKFEIEYVKDDLILLLKILLTIIDAQNDKNTSKSFSVISNSMGGAIQYLYPDFFELIKFEGMFSGKDKKGISKYYISPFFGVYSMNKTFKSKIKSSFKVYSRNMGHYVNINNISQLCLIGIPYMGLYNNKEPSVLYLKEQNEKRMLTRCVYLEAPNLSEKCEYSGLFHSGKVDDYDMNNITDKYTKPNSQVLFCINNIALGNIYEFHPENVIHIPPLPKPAKDMVKYEFKGFFKNNNINNRLLANLVFAQTSDQKYKYYIKDKDYKVIYNGKWGLRLIRLLFYNHPIAPHYSPIKIIKEYKYRSKRLFITKDDVQRSIKTTKAYYNEILNSKDVLVNTKSLEIVINDELVKNMVLPTNSKFTKMDIKRLFYIPITKGDIIEKEEKEDVKEIEKVERLYIARQKAKETGKDAIVLSPYTKNSIIILGEGTKDHISIFKKLRLSWKGRMKVWMGNVQLYDKIIGELDSSYISYVDLF